MDELNNGLNKEQMQILTDTALELGGSHEISYKQHTNEEIIIKHRWDFKPGGWGNTDISTDSVLRARAIRTINAWKRISEMHPKGKLQGVRLDATNAEIRWSNFVSVAVFYELMKEMQNN